jgi:class 3 adenylate cyclase
VRAVLFGDLEGFGVMRDEDLVAYIDRQLTSIARVLDRYGDAVIDRNTWGDGLFVAFTDVTTAARCALDLQEGRGRPSTAATPRLRMRIATHAGPVLLRTDPIRGVPTVFGRELTRTARIEPRTPPGEVYASSAFAALLRLDPHCDVVPEYVGRVTTAKDFETIAMYVLKRDAPAGASS